jgi:phosphatidate cytidylyltransferase
MGFVMSLKKGYLKQQFGLFCWVHMTLLLVVVSRYGCVYRFHLKLRTRFSSHFIVNNILEGLIWFWVPASLVICNDVFAYIWGVTFGRTPLIKLSPKKTVEGFVGAFFSTIVFSILWGTYFMRFDYMVCPVQDLGVSAWSSTGCEPNPVFKWRQWEMWKPLAILASAIVSILVSSVKALVKRHSSVTSSCSDNHIRTISMASSFHVLLCITCGAVWGFLRLRVQTRI